MGCSLYLSYIVAASYILGTGNQYPDSAIVAAVNPHRGYSRCHLFQAREYSFFSTLQKVVNLLILYKIRLLLRFLSPHIMMHRFCYHRYLCSGTNLPKNMFLVMRGTSTGCGWIKKIIPLRVQTITEESNNQPNSNEDDTAYTSFTSLRQ